MTSRLPDRLMNASWSGLLVVLFFAGSLLGCATTTMTPMGSINCTEIRNELMRVQTGCPSMAETDPDVFYQYCLESCPDNEVDKGLCRARCAESAEKRAAPKSP